jgi:hypothetical protein
MKNEQTSINSAVAAEIESLYKEIEHLKTIINTNKDVLFDLLEVLKSAKIPYHTND